MRKIAAVALVLLAACASSSKSTAPVTPPDVNIAQVYGPSDLPYSRGVSSVNAEWAIQVTNKADVPITLTHISLQSVGMGTMAMRREERSYQAVVPPGATGEVRLSAQLYFTSDSSGSPTREPLTLRATMNFDSPKGKFVKIKQQNLSQFPQ